MDPQLVKTTPDSTGMKFHIIRAHNRGSLYFLRVEPGGDDLELRSQLEEYISHALDSNIVHELIEFAFEVNNPNLDKHIRPVIIGYYHGSDQTMAQEIELIKESLRTYTRPAFHLLDVANHPFTPIVYKPEGIYVYFNSSTNKYVIVRKPFPFDYFPNFTLKWSEVNLTDTAIQFMFNQNSSITTSDEKVICAYRKFIESMVVKDVRGMDSYSEESYVANQVWTNDDGCSIRAFNEQTRKQEPFTKPSLIKFNPEEYEKLKSEGVIN